MKRLIGTLMATTLLLSACGGGELKGISTLPDIDTSSATMTEVRADGSSSPFTLKAPAGTVLVLYFGFTSCPDICPTTLADLGYAADKLKADKPKVSVAFATVDPERDSASVLVSYLDHYGFGAQGHALRPTDAELRSVEQIVKATSLVTKKSDGTVDVQHTSYTYVINDQGKVVDEFAFGMSADDMANDFKVLLARA